MGRNVGARKTICHRYGRLCAESQNTFTEKVSPQKWPVISVSKHFSMNFSATFHAGCGADIPETCFLLQFNILPNETEPFGYNNKPKEILGKEMEMHK